MVPFSTLLESSGWDLTMAENDMVNVRLGRDVDEVALLGGSLH